MKALLRASIRGLFHPRWAETEETVPGGGRSREQRLSG